MSPSNTDDDDCQNIIELEMGLTKVQSRAIKVLKFDNDHDPRRAIQGYLILAALTSTREPILLNFDLVVCLIVVLLVVVDLVLVVCGLVGLIVGAGVSSSPAKIGDLKT